MKKPFFIPLSAFWFKAFEQGEKTIEYRNAQSRFASIEAGRAITLSYGYSGRRIDCVCAMIELIDFSNAPIEAQKIYPNAEQLLAIHLKNFSQSYYPRTQMTTIEPLF